MTIFDSDDTLPGEDAISSASSLQVSKLGRFTILRELGAGGMGVVYAAYDETLDRKLAIKLLHARGVSQDPRLMREAQGLARLSHPNVVQIYEVGEHEGALFLAMEFVAGQTLRAWLREVSRTRAEILDVFLAAGRGLAAAHAARLIHRDFKPDNVMVGDDGRVRVMDFGLVRDSGDQDQDGELAGAAAVRTPEAALEASSSGALSTDLTVTGSVMGTPAYMPPEQHRGQPTDARSDQFSFCVALWEAIYGQRPFAGDNLAQLTLAILEAELREPPRGADVPAWLRKVIERGLASEPELRWPSMDALLQALTRDPTRWRRKALASVGVVALGLGGWLWWQAEQAAEAEASARARDQALARCEAEGAAIEQVWSPTARAALEAAFVAIDVPHAKATWGQVSAGLDDYTASWSAKREAVCVEAELDAARTPASAAVARACLDERLVALATLIDRLGEVDEGVLAKAPSIAARLPLLDACVDEGALARRIPPPEELDAAAIQALREQLAQLPILDALAAYDEGARVSAEALTAARGLGWIPVEVEAQYWVGRFDERLGDYEGARDELSEALLRAGEVGHDELAIRSASALSVTLANRLGAPDEGLRWAQIGEMFVGRSGAQGGLEHAILLDNLGVVHAIRGDLDQARAVLERAVAIKQSLLPPEHPELAGTLTNLGNVLRRSGANDEALALFERALASKRASLPADHPSLASALTNIANVHASRGSFERALEHFELALEIEERALPADHPDIASSARNVAHAHDDLGHHELALAGYERVLAILETSLPAGHGQIGLALLDVGKAQAALDRLDAAEASYTRGLAILEAPEAEISSARLARARAALAQVVAAREREGL